MTRADALRTSTTPLRLDPTVDAAARSTVASSAGTPSVVAEADESRRALTLSFNVFGAASLDVPLFLEDAYLLVRLDDGQSPPRVPTWDDYSYALIPGQTITLTAADGHLATLRATVGLALPDALDKAPYAFRGVVGEHTSC